jgi:hypothetical protein
MYLSHVKFWEFPKNKQLFQNVFSADKNAEILRNSEVGK